MRVTTKKAPTLDGLEQRLTGPLWRPGSQDYEREVVGFNLAVTHQPDVVVVAADRADVQAVLQFACATGTQVTVQATGHGAVAPVTNGILLKTARLDTLQVDTEGRTVRVGAAVRWREVIEACAPLGLAPLNGSSSDVSAVGYTVGGGLPVMGRTYGFAADRVRELDVVTPEGRLRRVTAESEPDLFWGLCGGQGNLGVVTAMVIELVELRSVYGGGLFFAAQDMRTVLHAYSAWCVDLPESTSTSVAVVRLPAAPSVPQDLRGQTLAHLRVCHDGPAIEGEALLAPMRALAEPLLDTVAPLPYARIDEIHQDPDHPVPFCQRGMLLRELTPATVDALLAVVGPDVATPVALCEIRQLGGALGRAPLAGNAVGGRTAAFSLLALAVVTPETSARAPDAVDAVLTAAQPWATGRTFVNLHGSRGDEADLARAWEPETYERLRRLVATVDPQGVLRSGHAIGRPA